MNRIFTSILTIILAIILAGCGGSVNRDTDKPSDSTRSPAVAPEENLPDTAPPEEFVLIHGGTFQMGSLETEAWRVEDETAHTVTTGDFYMGQYEVTQEEYQAVTGENPSAFSVSVANLPVENIS